MNKAYIITIILMLLVSVIAISGNINNAQCAPDTDLILKKLDKVLENQDLIFEKLTEVKEELRIVKIRATLSK